MSNTAVQNVLVFIFSFIAQLFDLLFTYIPYRLIFIEKNTAGKKIYAKPSCPEQNGISPYRDVSIERLQAVPEAGIDTLTKLIKRSIEKRSDSRCLGTREVLREEEEKQPSGKVFKKLILGKYKWLTYKEVDMKMEAISRGLMTYGIQPKEKIAICAETRADWLLSAHSAFVNSIIGKF